MAHRKTLFHFKNSRARWFIASVIVVLAGIIAAVYTFHPVRAGDAQSVGASVSQAQPVPVTVEEARRRDVPIYLHAIATVQALNSVSIRTRVDGELQQVAFVEGQDVKRGDVLAQIDSRPFVAALDQAVAKRAQDDAQLGNARADLQRYANLVQQNFISRQQLDTQRALVAQFEAQVKADDAAIASARTQLDYTTIRSPIDGRTGIRQVDPGNILHASDQGAIVVIAQLDPIAVIFTLPEQDLAAVNDAMARGPVAVTALSQDDSQELGSGRLLLVDNQIDATTGTVRLKATFSNANHALWPGEFVNVRVLLSTQKAQLTIPADAVQRGANGSFAYVVEPGGIAELRWLKVARLDGDTAVVDEGLGEGERVVTAGQYRVRPGVRVDVPSTDQREADSR
jgi:multidrug efflux system membrane fusion protein